FEYLIAIIKSSFMMYYIEQFVRNSIIGAEKNITKNNKSSIKDLKIYAFVSISINLSPSLIQYIKLRSCCT
ncbi:hypothetical protein CUR38_03250, partial [Latilactobacillus sakei]